MDHIQDISLPFIRNYSIGSHIFKISKDLGKNVKTIFEQAGDGNFFSATNVIFRGSKFNAPNEYNSTNIIKDIEEVFKNPSKYFETKEVPKITVGYIPTTDALMHELGFNNQKYIKEIINADKAIGNLISTLKDLGYYDSTAIALISDHGNYRAKEMYDLEPFFEKHNLIPYNPKKGGDFDAAFGSLGRFNFHGDTWFHHPTLNQLKNYELKNKQGKKVNIFKILWQIPKVKFMFYPDDKNNNEKGIIYLRKKDPKSGEIFKGRIEYLDNEKDLKTKYSYKTEELFGYIHSEDKKSFLDGEMHTIDEWLANTYDINFPILIDQLARYFKNPRSCDIMISTIGECGFGYEHGKTKSASPYSHDIALSKSMIVPFIIGGSDNIPLMNLQYCKTVDMVPTLLDLLGDTPDLSVVGKSLTK
ncbi:MAG: alkaline phosphatase family protein [Candidatus Lokiarchaeota archaeon]